MITKHIPNTLTLGNLACGCVGIIACAKGNVEMGSYMIWLAAIFDFLDGFVARTLKVSSPIGKELDSLADMVTFGVLPSIMLYSLLESKSDGMWPYIAFLLALFSALRLAKFNIDTRQTNGFIGMPTPAAAFFVSGLAFWPYGTFLLEAPSLAAISVVLSTLLVIPIPMIALKFKDFSFKNNFYRYALVIVSVALLAVFGKRSFPIIITSYVGLSLLAALLDKSRQQ